MATTGSPQRLIIVHGFGANIDRNWFPWLAQSGPEAIRVVLPDTTRPLAQTWIPEVTKAIGHLDETTAVVAHSLGCITAANAIAALAATGTLGWFVAVAPFSSPLPATVSPDLDRFIDTEFSPFLEHYDPAAVAAATSTIAVVRSDADTIVPATLSDQFAEQLGAPVDVIPGAGHFLDEEGILELPIVRRILNC